MLLLQVPIIIVALLLISKVSSVALSQDQCVPPPLKLAVLEETKNHGGCTLLKNVCADDGMLVTFDTKYSANNLTRASPYGVLENQSGLWNFPARGGSNSDALVGHQPNSFVAIRSASRREGSPQLQRPSFSRCTMPVIMTTDWPYNWHEVFAQLVGIADVYFRQKGMIDDSATLVLATPDGLAALTYHHVLLSPFSRYPLVTFDELSQRPARDRVHKVSWSAEGYHVSCFQRAVLCKLHGFPQGMMATATTVLQHIGPRLPVDPLGFSPPGRPPVPVSSDTTLRVLLEARAGPARNIRNLPELVQECDRANQAGFKAGAFNSLSCKVLDTADTPSLNGAARFYTTVAAVRSAHVLVAVHGAGASNVFFMEADNGGTALLEVRPCNFGTKYCGWPDAYMQSQLRNAGYPVLFFAYNVEDAQQCHPSDYEAAALKSPQDTPMRGGDDMRSRDQHVTLRPGPFLAMLRHIASLLRHRDAWSAAQGEARLHGYAVPEGVVLGPLCVRDMPAHLANGATLIRT